MTAWKGGLQSLLDEFFSALSGNLVRLVSKSALSQARKKLKASAFVALNQRLLSLLSCLLPDPRWKGFRLVASDSTTLRLPPNAQNREAFGVQLDSAGRPYVLARALGLYATVSRSMLQARVVPFLRDERSLLAEAVPALSATDLLVLDRGFPAVWLFALFQQLSVHFLARIDKSGWPLVEAFARSGEMERQVSWQVSSSARRRAKALGFDLSLSCVAVRLIRVVLPNGHIEVLATSLLDSQAYPAADFGALYHQRWGIEEAFKVLKHRLMVEQFSGESPESIHQDFQAKLLVANIAAALTRSAQESLPEETSARYQTNFTYALYLLRSQLRQWLISLPCTQSIANCLALFASTLELRRPGRSSPRPPSRPLVKPRRAYK